MSEPTPNPRDPNAPLSNSLAAWMLQNQPELALRPAETFAAARELANRLVERDGFDGSARIESVQNLPGGVPVFGQGNRNSSLSTEDWGKVYAAVAPELGLPGQGRESAAAAQSQPAANGAPAATMEVPSSSPAGVTASDVRQAGSDLPQPVAMGANEAGLERRTGYELQGNGSIRFDPNTIGTGDFRFANSGVNTVGLGLDSQNLDFNLRGNSNVDTGQREILGNTTIQFDPNTVGTGDFRFANNGVNTIGGSVDGRDVDASLRYNNDVDTGQREVIGNTTVQFDPNTVGTGDFRFANNGVNTIGGSVDGRDVDASLRYNNDVDTGQREVIGSTTVQFDPNTVGTGDFRFANNGVNTIGGSIDGRDVDASLRYNNDLDTGQREVVGNTTIQFDPNTVGTGDFRFANNGVNTIGGSVDGRDVDASLRYNNDVDTGQREVIGKTTIQFDPNTVGTGDFRFANNGVNTIGGSVDGRDVDASLRYNNDVDTGQREVVGNTTIQFDPNTVGTGDFRFANNGVNTIGGSVDGRDVDASLRYNNDVDTGQREVVGNTTIQFDPNTVGTGDFRFANNGVNTIGGSVDGRDVDASLRYNNDVDTGQREVVGNTTIQFDPNTVGTGDFRFANNGVNTIGGSVDGRDVDASLRYNNDVDTGQREVVGNTTIQFDPNTVGTGDFRFANNGVNTIGGSVDGRDVDASLRYNNDVDTGQREVIGNTTIQFDPNTVGTGDFRFANNGVNTIGVGLDSQNLDFNLRGNRNVDNGQSELLGNTRIQFDPNTVGTGDFRLGNFGTNTVGIGLDSQNFDFNLRGNRNVDNGQSELLGDTRIQFDPNTVGTGDFRLGNFGTNTVGIGLDSQNFDFSLRGNRNVENGQHEVLGNGAVQLNPSDRLSGDFRVGNFGPDRFGINFNRGDEVNGFDLGAMGSTRDGGTPAQFNIRSEYRFGSDDQRLNYAVNGQLGTESQLGGRVSYNPNDEFRLNANAAYNFATNVGTGSLEAVYKPKDRDLSIFAGASVNTRGESSAMIGLRLNFRDTGGGAVGNDLQLPEQSSIDSAVVTHRISQLQGRDRELYDQAFDQVNRLNAGGANLPQPAAALGMASFADEKGINIADARMVTGQDGKQTVWIGNASLDNPATQSFSIGRDQLANTEPNEALNQLAANNWQQQNAAQNQAQNNPQQNPQLDALEQQRVGMGGR